MLTETEVQQHSSLRVNAATNRKLVLGPAKPKRSRAHNKKVKSGCGTCKKRHKKCDEIKPACDRCTSNGYVCDGYLSEADVITPPEKNVVLSTHRPLILPDWKEVELRYFDVFRRYSVPQLSGGFEGDFWNRFILRSAQAAPCIRHTIVALGALHEDAAHRRAVVSSKCAASPIPPPSDFVLQQYSKALAAVHAFASENGEEALSIVLSACVLFICFETLRGNHDTVLMHTRSGIQMFADGVKRTGTDGQSIHPFTDGPVPLNSILPVFTRLDVQALSLLDPISLTTQRFSGFAPLQGQLPVPAAFETLEQAKISLLDMQHVNAHEIHKVIEQCCSAEPCDWPEADYYRLLEGKAYNLARLAQWREALQPLVNRCEDGLQDLYARRATYVLLVHHQYAAMTLHHFPSRDEMHFDDYTAGFEKMLRLARPAVSIFRSEPYLARLTILMDLGLAEPIFWVVRRCRDPKVRREALDLLEACPGFEGIWQSKLAANIGRRTIELEEAASPGPVNTTSDVPRRARMWEVLPLFGTNAPEGTLMVRFIDEAGGYVDEEFSNFNMA